MMGHRITLLGNIARNIQDWLTSHPAGHERGAIVLFRRLARPVKGLEHSDRYLAVEIIEMKDDWVLHSSKIHLEINMRKLPPLYARCESEDLVLGFVHNHPSGYPNFSSQDDLNEMNILHGLAGCNGPNSLLVNMLLVGDQWFARVRQGYHPENVIPIRHILILSDKIEVHGVSTDSARQPTLERQETAFGKPFNDKMQSLRVAVIGLGGTGSPAATLLARCGIGELVLIDNEDLERSNMNRVRGYIGADINKSKAKSLEKFIKKLGLNVSVVSIPSNIGEDPKALDAVSTADVVLGCTDGQAGRDIMNQAMYYYGLVYIDMGLTGFVDQSPDAYPYLRDHRARVSCILPEHGACLRCQRVVKDEWLKYEQAVKEDPELANLDPETLEREYYLIGGGEEAPGVGPFTSATADFAVATLMNLIRPFHRIALDLRSDNIWLDFVHLNIHSNEPIDDPNCIYCSKHVLLLKHEDKYRLDQPSLGEIDYSD